MTNRRILGLKRAKGLLLVITGALALAGTCGIGLIVGIGSAPAVRAQSPPSAVMAPATALPEFDAASIKLIDRSVGGSRGSGPVWFEPGRAFTKNSVTASRMILAAYHFAGFSTFWRAG